jgi:uroporphyrinogen-III synthase
MTKTDRAGLIVITRPEHQAEPIAAALAARGYASMIEPMLDIVPLDTALPALDRFGGLAFSSANAASIFAARMADRTLPAYAVGERTADTLRRAGFLDVRVAEGDARRLAALIARTYDGPQPILHLSGRAVARDLSVLLEPQGRSVERLVIYDAVPAVALSLPFVKALYARTVDGVLFFSARTAQVFGTLITKSGFDSLTGGIAALCLSEAVGEEARRLSWRSVTVADRPDAESLLALLPPVPQGQADG